MSYQVEYANIHINNYVTILNVNRTILPTRQNFTRDIISSNLEFYTGYKYSRRKITLECLLEADTKEEFLNKKSELAYILDVKLPSKMVISDELDKCYYAILDGETNLDKLVYNASFNLNFICYDTIIYQNGYSSLLMDGNKTFNFTDMGTYNSNPIFGFKFSKPSSFIYLANEKSEAMLVGSKSNTTLETIQENKIIVNDDCTDSSKFTSGGSITVGSNRINSGSFGVGNNGNSIIATNYGSDISNRWIGPTFRKNLGKSLEQFEVKVNFSFSSQGNNFTALNTKDLIRVIRKSGTYMYASELNTSTIIELIPYETDLNIIKLGSYTNCQVSYNGKTGWISTNDVGRIKINTPTTKAANNTDEQMGLIECVGYDVNGQILFRFHIRDDNKYFEHVIPEVYIKDKLYLSSNTTIPTPNTVMDKDDEGKPIGEIKIPSGAFGSWNDYTGTFTIRRKKIDNGAYRWWASINRTNDGINIVQEINMGGGIINNTLPVGELSHIIFYIAKYDQAEPVDIMSVNHITVKDISSEDKPQTNVNVAIFNKDDFLEIDFEKCTVKLNNEDFIHKLDVGSQFFNVEKNSIVAIKTDDTNIQGNCSYRKRYIG